MRLLYEFLIEPKDGKIFDNIREGIIVNSSEDERLFANREAIVAKVPHGYKGDIEEGDTLIVHHNMFVPHYNMQGKYVKSSKHFKDNLYRVDPDGFFMYKKKNGTDWIAHDRYCFVKPIPLLDDGFLKKLGTEEPLMGEMIYPNEYLTRVGIKKGDIIIFTPDSEYEFQIDGVKMYRVYDHQVTIQLN